MIDLPFFEDRHRDLAARVAALGDQFEAVVALGESGEEDRAGRETIRIAAEHGLCRLLVPREFGGDGLDLRSLCLTREAVAAASGLADSVFAVQGLGSYPIALSGDNALGERFLTGVASGRAIAAFALTEPEAGSDAAAVTTRAVREGDSYVIDGFKTLISNATIASFFVVFARTAEGSKRAISAFVVPAGTPGLSDRSASACQCAASDRRGALHTMSGA